MQALAKSPADRFRTAGEFAAAFYQSLCSEELELVDSLGQVFRLYRGTTRVGRDPDNELIAATAAGEPPSRRDTFRWDTLEPGGPAKHQWHVRQ